MKAQSRLRGDRQRGIHRALANEGKGYGNNAHFYGNEEEEDTKETQNQTSEHLAERES